MFPDPWPDRWTTLIIARAGERPVLKKAVATATTPRAWQKRLYA
jgi:hypothetical protein